MLSEQRRPTTSWGPLAIWLPEGWGRWSLLSVHHWWDTSGLLSVAPGDWGIVAPLLPLKRAKRAGGVWLQEESVNSSVILWIICSVFKILPDWEPRSQFGVILAFPPTTHVLHIHCFEINLLFYQLVTQCCELAFLSWQDKKKLCRKEPRDPGGQTM